MHCLSTHPFILLIYTYTPSINFKINNYINVNGKLFQLILKHCHKWLLGLIPTQKIRRGQTLVQDRIFESFNFKITVCNRNNVSVAVGKRSRCSIKY